jgi:hypothetical protein
MNKNAAIANEDPLLDGKAAASYLGLRNCKTLDVWRSRHAYPELVPVFIGRNVKYRKSALENFIAARTRKVKAV